MSVNSSKVSALVQALKDVFENKQVNKKDDISGDFSSDTVSYPTVKAVKTWTSNQLSGKQDTLSSGTTIKTINNESILGSGNITVSTGSIDLIEIVNSLPTASSSTMNKLYLIAEATSQTHDAYEVYVTVRTGTSGSYSYAWEKVDTARVDLSGYATITGVDSQIDDALDAITTALSS